MTANLVAVVGAAAFCYVAALVAGFMLGRLLTRRRQNLTDFAQWERELSHCPEISRHMRRMNRWDRDASHH